MTGVSPASSLPSNASPACGFRTSALLQRSRRDPGEAFGPRKVTHHQAPIAASQSRSRKRCPHLQAHWGWARRFSRCDMFLTSVRRADHGSIACQRKSPAVNCSSSKSLVRQQLPSRPRQHLLGAVRSPSKNPKAANFQKLREESWYKFEYYGLEIGTNLHPFFADFTCVHFPQFAALTVILSVY